MVCVVDQDSVGPSVGPGVVRNAPEGVVCSGTHLAAVVVEHGGDVLFGECSGGVGDEEAGLPHSAITNNHTLYGLHGLVPELSLYKPEDKQK